MSDTGRSRAVNDDRVYRMWRAQKKARAMDDWNVRGAVYDVARQFGIPCAGVRDILARRRATTGYEDPT